MNNYKPCRQCGEIKPLDQFRKYYGGRKGHYTTCKLCEKINSREKYLSRKYDSGAISEDEALELYKIHQLWEYQMTLGLKPPRFSCGRTTPIAENLDSMLERYKVRAEHVTESVPSQASNAAPPELLKWLIEPLTEEPEYYQDEVYEELTAKYKPQLRIDRDSMLPVYDMTHAEILNKIAARFDNYEDTYYDKE